jgi:hypothetical protein
VARRRPPLIIGVGFLLLGVVLMVIWYAAATATSSAASPRSPTRALIESAPAGR